jgi:hypothetical protein
MIDSKEEKNRETDKPQSETEKKDKTTYSKLNGIGSFPFLILMMNEIPGCFPREAFLFSS